MTDASHVEAASRRLQAALAALEAAVEGRIDDDRGHAALASQVDAFDADRARLASELDAAAARVRELETVNREVSRRLDNAIETIRSILETSKR